MDENGEAPKERGIQKGKGPREKTTHDKIVRN